MARWKKVFVGGVLGLGVLGVVLGPPHDAGNPPAGVAVPLGPRVIDLLDPDHSHDERHLPSPPESPVAAHIASATITNAGDVQERHYFYRPTGAAWNVAWSRSAPEQGVKAATSRPARSLLPLALTIVAACIIIGVSRVVAAVRELCGHRLESDAKPANSTA